MHILERIFVVLLLYRLKSLLKMILDKDNTLFVVAAREKYVVIMSR